MQGFNCSRCFQHCWSSLTATDNSLIIGMTNWLVGFPASKRGEGNGGGLDWERLAEVGVVFCMRLRGGRIYGVGAEVTAADGRFDHLLPISSRC